MLLLPLDWAPHFENPCFRQIVFLWTLPLWSLVLLAKYFLLSSRIAYPGPLRLGGVMKPGLINKLWAELVCVTSKLQNSTTHVKPYSAPFFLVGVGLRMGTYIRQCLPHQSWIPNDHHKLSPFATCSGHVAWRRNKAFILLNTPTSSISTPSPQRADLHVVAFVLIIFIDPCNHDDRGFKSLRKFKSLFSLESL